MTIQLRRYTFKLYPNSEQVSALREHARMCALLWNGLLELRERTVMSDGGAARRFDDRGFNRWDIDDELAAIDARSPVVVVDDRERRKYSAADDRRRGQLFAKLRARRNEARRLAAGERGARGAFDPKSVDTSDIDAEIAALEAAGEIVAERRGRPVRDGATEALLKAARARRAARIKAARIAAIGVTMKAPTAFDQGKDLTALRAECPEWAGMPRGTQERVAEMLGDAFAAFFRRAKAGERGGYPRFKQVHDDKGEIAADSVHLREPAKSCWTFAPSESANRGLPPGLKAAVNPKAQSESPRNCIGLREGPCGDPANTGGTQERASIAMRGPTCGDPANTGGTQEVVSSATCGDPANTGGTQARWCGAPCPTTCGDPANAGETQGSSGAGRSRSPCGDHANTGETQEQNRRYAEFFACGDPANAGKKTGRTWRLRIRGIPGAIRARGRFPVSPSAMKTADIRYEAGAWWFSIAVAIDRGERAHGAENLRVEFDLIDEFARVTRADGPCGAADYPDFGLDKSGIPPTFNGLPECPCGDAANAGEAQGHGGEGFAEISCGDAANAGEAQERPRAALSPSTCGDAANAGEAQGIRLVLKSGAPCGDAVNAGEAQAFVPRSFGDAANAVDSLKSDRDRRYKRGSLRWLKEKSRIARISARSARQRREYLHRWSTAIIARASALEIISAPVAETRTGRGTEAKPGAEVATIAALNRRVRELAPASAVQMLKYKAGEAGIAFEEIRRENHEIRVGGEIRASAIADRKARAKARKSGVAK